MEKIFLYYFQYIQSYPNINNKILWFNKKSDIKSYNLIASIYFGKKSIYKSFYYEKKNNYSYIDGYSDMYFCIKNLYPNKYNDILKKITDKVIINYLVYKKYKTPGFVFNYISKKYLSLILFLINI